MASFVELLMNLIPVQLVCGLHGVKMNHEPCWVNLIVAELFTQRRKERKGNYITANYLATRKLATFMHSFSIRTPTEFSFSLCLAYLQRSPLEVLHRCEDNSVTKALRIEGKSVVFRVREGPESQLLVEILNGSVSSAGSGQLISYVRDWFDLDTKLKPFYRLAGKDELLKGLVKKFRGYRIVGQPDLFESLVWAVLGQQINLSFAYKLKNRFVSEFGERQDLGGNLYFMFPSPEAVSKISANQLLALQFSRQKASYTLGISAAFLEGRISKEKLMGLPLEEAKHELMKIKGVGNWTANYALMKTFHLPDAFPLEDAGLHNAIKQQLNLRSKPDLNRVKRIFKKYKGWEAYSTLYLWKSLT